MASMVSWISEPLPFASPSCSSANSLLPPDWLTSDLLFCPIAPAALHHQPPLGTAVTPAPPRVAKRKRKSRALKSSLTTYISTDAANFRHMVQHVTGVGFDCFPDQCAEPTRPEPNKRPACTADSMQSVASCGCTVLPTLHTSAFLLDQQEQQPSIISVDHEQLLAAPAAHHHPRMDPHPLHCFPTLESWSERRCMS